MTPTATAEIVEPVTESEITETAPTGDLVLEDLLVEEVSIDGMCGVY